jgi:CHAD domain-containing protein
VNSGSPGSNGHRRSPRRAQSSDRLDAWKRQLARCGRKPTRKRVHALRVVTLRILAELEYQIGEQGKNGPGILAATRWIKLGERLRQVLSPVREADVWLDKLAALRQSLANTNGYSPRSNKFCIRQIDELEDRLKTKRRQWEKELVTEIASRRDRLEESAQKIQLAPVALDLAGGASQGDAGSSEISEQFGDVVAKFASLDENNLHEFRKQIKKVRYMAEIFAAHDPEAGRQAMSIRKMQSAIGEWHDWQALAKREGHAHGRRAELTELLETLAAESLEKALAVCERVTKNLLKKGNGAHDLSDIPAKKPPVRSAEPMGSPALSNLA